MTNRFPYINLNRAAQKRWQWQRQREQILKELQAEQQELQEELQAQTQQTLAQQNYHNQQNAYLQNYIDNQKNLDMAEYHEQDRSQQVELSQVQQLLANFNRQAVEVNNQLNQLHQQVQKAINDQRQTSP